MNLNDFAKEVHQNAVKHGWWDEERTFGEIIALCHSELSEALEEFRAKRPMVWFGCAEADPEKPCRPEDEYDCLNYGKRWTASIAAPSPRASPWSWLTASSAFWITAVRKESTLMLS